MVKKNKLSNKFAKQVFKSIDALDDAYWKIINCYDRALKDTFGEEYELAIVEGEVVGIGKVNKDKKKIVFHR